MELVAMHQFCHQKQVHSIGDMEYCDGLTIKLSMFMMTKGRSLLEFPCQRPTRAQLNLWKHAVGSNTILGICLQTPVGAFTADPHRPNESFTNTDGLHIYHMPSSDATAVYVYLQRNAAVLTALEGCQTLLRKSTKEPTRCRELVSGWPDYIGVVDASGHGVG